MNFKTLIAHYDSLPKDQLIQKLVDKNALLLKQENEITRLTKEVKDIREIEQDHKQLNGNLQKELDKLGFPKSDFSNLISISIYIASSLSGLSKRVVLRFFSISFSFSSV